MRALVLTLIMVVMAAISIAQQLHQAESFNLNYPVTGNHIFEASKFIDLSPGFEYIPSSGNDFVGRINPFLVFPPIAGEIGCPPGADPQYSGMFGAVNMTTDVAASGNAIISLPITVCPGISGIIPQLSVVYNSNGTYSYMGKGWGINGISAISKVAKNYYYDGENQAVFNAPGYEIFALDGQRLIWDEQAQYYRTEFANFSKIIREYDDSQIKFKVFAKDGSIIEYGYTADSRNTLLKTNGQLTTDAVVFYVNKLSDIYGNSIEFKYTNDQGTCYPDEIVYGKTASNPLGNSIKFLYTDQEIYAKSFILGADGQPNYCVGKKILNTIKVFDGSALFRRYEFTYETHGEALKKYLTLITEYNGADEKYYPVEFTWQLEEDGYEVSVDECNNETFEDRNLLYDLNYKTQIIPSYINNDLLLDYYSLTSANRPDYQKCYKYINNGNGFDKTEITNSFDFLYGPEGFYEKQVYTVGDFDSDSKDDIVLLNDSYVLVYSAEGQNNDITLKKALPSPDGSVTQALTADMNGDGIADLILVRQRADVVTPPKCYIFFGSVNGFVNNQPPNYVLSIPDVPVDATDVSVKMGDFDGNGSMDFLIVYYWLFQAHQNIFYNNNGAFIAMPISNFDVLSARSDKSDFEVGDFNGDMKSDILWIYDESIINNDQNILLLTSSGNGVFTPTINYETYIDLFKVKNSGFLIGDFNQDGRSDFIQYDKYLPAAIQLFTINKEANSFDNKQILFPVFPSVPPPINSDDYYPKSTFVAGDFNGDGNIDLLNQFEECQELFWDWQEDIIVRHNIGFTTTEKNSVITKVTNSLGNETEYLYSRMSDHLVYQSNESPTYPFNKFRENLMLVKEFKISDGNGGWFKNAYSYSNAILHVTGKGFVGFKENTIRNDNSSRITKYFRSDEYKSFGLLVQNRELQTVMPNNIETNVYDIYTTTSNLDIGNPSKPSHFLYSSATITYDKINNTWKKVEQSDPDSYGNVCTVITKSGIEGCSAEHTTTITNQYQNFTSNNQWILGRLTNATSIQKYLNESSITRTSSFTYFSNGRLETETIEPGNAKSTTKTYHYDEVGNIDISTITATGLPSVTTTTVYDTDKQFITKVIDNLGHTNESLNHNSYGLATLTKDANQNETALSYDNFGRHTQTTLPDGNISRNVFRWVQTNDQDAPENAVYYTWGQTSGSVPVIVYMNSVAQPLRTVTFGFDGRKTFIDTKYDSQGRVEKVSDPYASGETVQWTVNQYDYLGRIQSVTDPGYITTSYSYSPLESTVTNALNQTKKTKVNTMGWVVESIDHLNTKVINEYNSGGFNTNTYVADATGTKISGTEIKKEYDLFGNCTKLTDPNLGERTFAYNAYGQLESEKKVVTNEITSYIYDAIGRPLTKTEPGSKLTSWVYDTKPDGIGLVSTVTYQSSSEEYFYDDLSRPYKKTIRIDQTDYSFENTYDVYGRVSETKYPTGIEIVNEYNSNGYLYKVIQKDTGKKLWEGTAFDTKGRIKAETIGDYINTTFEYQPGIGLLSNIKSLRSGATLQNWDYIWDNFGNLKTRKNLKLNKIEQFDYDGLNRLTYYERPGSTAVTVAYDVLGNITAKSDAATLYTYDDDNPYKLSSVQAYSSAINAFTQNVQYTSFDKISQVSENGNTLNLYYGYDHQRIKQVITTSAGNSFTRLYIGSTVEKNINNGEVSYDNYINGGNGVCAIITTYQGSAPAEYKYVLKDHLGSVQMLVDNNGNVLEEMNYDPWGRRRDPITYAYIGTVSHVTSRGFTGHEHMDLFALINMNGRVYDPVLGRFLSADPYIQDPSSALGLNGYSYCLNNPLSLTDPTGYYTSFAEMAGGTVSQLLVIGAYAVNPALGVLVSVSANMLTVLENGGSFNNALRAGEKTFAFSVVSAFGTDMIGDYFAQAMNKAPSGSLEKLAFERALAHGAFQGTLAFAQGGNFVHGFVSSVTGSLVMDFTGGTTTNRVIVAAVAGGTASMLTGGKFMNGATTAAFVVLLNHVMHEGDIWMHTVEEGQNCYDIIREYFYLFDRNELQILNPSIDIFNGGKPLTAGLRIKVPGPRKTLIRLPSAESPGFPKDKTGGWTLLLQIIMNSPHSPLYQGALPGQFSQNRAYFNEKFGYFEWNYTSDGLIKVNTFVDYIKFEGTWRGVYRKETLYYSKNGDLIL